jgi:hypothetical protein
MRRLAAFAGYLALLVFIHGSKTATAARILLLSIIILVSIWDRADLLIKGLTSLKVRFPREVGSLRRML